MTRDRWGVWCRWRDYDGEHESWLRPGGTPAPILWFSRANACAEARRQRAMFKPEEQDRFRYSVRKWRKTARIGNRTKRRRAMKNREDAARLRAFAERHAISTKRSIVRDGCGDVILLGRNGHARFYSDDAILLYLLFPGRPRAWAAAKSRLAGFTVSQDGDDEGSIIVPDSAAQSDAIRAALGVRRRRKADSAANLSQYRFGG